MITNAAQVLLDAARRRPQVVALVDRGEDGAERRVATVAELALAARRVAAALETRRAGRGVGERRVAIWAANSMEFAAGWFGAALAGWTLVPLSTSMTKHEASARVSHAGAHVVLCDVARQPVATEVRRMLPAGTFDVVGLDAVVRSERAMSASMAATRSEDPALILYTSGTTGRPKGAVITHGSLIQHTMAVASSAVRLGLDDAILGALPMSHSYGCRMVMLLGLFTGARIVCVPRFSARRTAQIMVEEGVTWLPAVPTMFAAWAELDPRERRTRPTALRWALSAGAPLSADTQVRAEAALDTEIRQGYGMTEATFATIDAPPHVAHPGSVGRLVWGVEVRVVDATGAALGDNKVGELHVRGPNRMRDYLDAPRATEAVLTDDGWVRSGDLGYVDPDGRVFVVDRRKDLILRGGHSVYPSELEAVVASHPAIAEVAVVGRPDAFYGEEIVAVVVLTAGARLDPNELASFLRERIGDDRRPRELVEIDALPLGPSRKVLKRELRAALSEGKLRPTRLGA